VWSEVETNLSQFKQLRDRNANIQLHVCTTVNVFNVFYLEHVANWIDQQGFDFVYWNMMHEAYYFSISTLPESAKTVIANRLNTSSVSDLTRKEFNNIIDFMNRGASLDGNILRMKIADLDRKRQQTIATVQPEFAHLINYVDPN